MRGRSAALSLAILLAAGCASPSPSAQRASAPASPESPDPVPAGGELYLASIVDTDGPGFGVRVEVAAPNGLRRRVAELAKVLPTGWDDATATDFYEPPIGPTRQIVLSAERDVSGETTETHVLVVDLAGSGRPVVDLPLGTFESHWGPGGELAVSGQKPYVIDLSTATKSEIRRPAGIETLGVWLADGSGWQAGRQDDSIYAPGRLTPTGEFVAGVPEPYEVTGLERIFGEKGGTLTMAVSDGPTGSEAAIIEIRGDLAPPCQCVAWARSTDPGDAPQFQEATWDRAGTGIWIVFSQGRQRWLSHVQTPLVDTKVADLPPDRGWRVVGISNDDRWVVLRVDESEPRAALALVDTRAGTARILAEPEPDGALPTFGGWVR